MQKRISVFGGTHTIAGEHDYEEAVKLGRYLGEYGYIVITGGYIGTMEAVSKGAAESGAHVIGVTCDEIESYRPIGPNQWVVDEIRHRTLRERIFTLINDCDAAIALPGGVGTLLEIIMMWNHLIIKAISPRYMILVGKGWEKTILTFLEQLNQYVPGNHPEYLIFVPDVKSALKKVNDLV